MSSNPSSASSTPSPAAEAQSAAAATVLCRTPEDFYAPAARYLARRHFAPFFDEHQTSPLETLHSLRLLNTAESHPLFRAVLEALADRQASACQQSVHNRLTDLFALVKTLGSTVSHRLKQHAPEIISAVDLPKVVTAAGRLPSPVEADFYVYATLTQTLHSCRDRAAKMDLLMGFIERLEDDPSALVYLDTLLADHLALRGVASALWQKTANPNDMLVDIIALYLNNDLASPATTPPSVRRLQTLLRSGPFPQVRDSLITVLQTVLQSSDRLITSVPDDPMGTKLAIAEVMAAADLMNALRLPDGFIGGQATYDILDRRLSLMLSADKLQELLRGRSILEKLRQLFALQQAMAGAAAVKGVDDYLISLLENRDFVGRLCDAIEDSDARLRAFSELQMLVLGSTFPAAIRKRLATMLDRAQHDQLKTTTLFSTLRKDAKPPIAAILRVVDMAGDGVFTHGKCLTEARELIRRHIRHRDFVRKYLAGKDIIRHDSAATAPETPLPPVGDRLRELGLRMARAGVEFRDLSGMTLLVVEDEESARHYIEMVLRDMGIGTVMTAPDGRAALKVFSDFEDGIDLIICDWKMPHMTGIDFLKQVRSVKPKLPFLMVTALATLENVKEAMAHEVTAYIAKPFPPEQLEEKVLLLLNRASPEEVSEELLAAAGGNVPERK